MADNESVLGIPSDQLAMISRKANVGLQSFEDVVSEVTLTVDKSMFIKRFLEVRQSCLVFLRPRRFGKSLNLSMLKCFLDQEVKDHVSIFKDFAIMKEQEVVEQHMGKYPVIFLSLKDCKSGTWAKMRHQIWLALCRMCAPYLEPGRVTMDYFSGQSYVVHSDNASAGDGSDIYLADIFSGLVNHLHQTHKKRVMVIVDEYDTPLNVEMTDEKDRKDRLEFFQQFFSSALKDNYAVKKACLAGVYHIRGANIFSGFNNSRIYTIRDSSKFSDCFGFTEREVKSLLKDAFNASEENVNNLWEKEGGIKEWYNGYCIGGNMVINPWSFMNCVEGKFAFESYWVKTTPAESLFKAFQGRSFDFTNMLGIIRTLMRRNTDGSLRRMKVGELNSELNISKRSEWTSDKILHFLVVTGYLTYTAGEVWIPNKEIFMEWENLVADIGGFGEYDKVRNFFGELACAFKDFNCDRIMHFMKTAIDQIANRASGEEHIYQHYIGGILSILQLTECKSLCETGAGNGFADQVLSFENVNRSVIIEYKHTQSTRDLDALAEAALNQITARKYMHSVPSNHEVLLIGCAIGESNKRVVSFRFRQVLAGESMTPTARSAAEPRGVSPTELATRPPNTGSRSKRAKTRRE